MNDAPAWIHVVVFLVSAAVIWWAGTRLERHAGAIAERTKLGQAFFGVLLLAAATSLPEVATTVTAIVVLGNPTLAVHNLLGGVALQTVLLVVADRAMRERGALTSLRPQFALLLQAVGLLLLLQIAIAGVAAHGVPIVASTSAWSVVLLGAYAGVMYLYHRGRGSSPWTPVNVGSPEPSERSASEQEGSVARAWLMFALMSGLVLVGGWFATSSADALAEVSGLGSAFIGATLLALATSLPELSTTVSSARRGRYAMATSNILGSNAFDVTLLVVADVLLRGDSIFRHVEPSAVFVATIGAIMTCIYLWGMLEREDRTVLGIGWDSAAVGVVYIGGMAVLYALG